MREAMQHHGHGADASYPHAPPAKAPLGLSQLVLTSGHLKPCIQPVNNILHYVSRMPCGAAAARAAAGAAPKRRRGRQPSFGRPVTAPKPKGPPPKVELVDIPSDVPEQVPIFCNGRNAVLDIRLQRVIYEGDEMPPSRFEQVCGKGDAKKWKATLFHFSEAEQRPTVCMQVRRHSAVAQHTVSVSVPAQGVVKCTLFVARPVPAIA